MTVAAAPPTEVHVDPRPDVLAYPSPTTSRFVVFLAALLTAGAFVGAWLHNQVLGDAWLDRVLTCRQQGVQIPAAGGITGEIARNAVEERCRASVERRRAAFSFGGALTAGGLGLLVLFVVPASIERRRRLRAMSPRLADAGLRMRELASGAGVARTPTLMLGPSTQRDAFSYGSPGRYKIALPPAVAVRWRDQALFDPLIDHELAHIRHRDVALAWLARSVWYALAPLLALPVVVALVSGDVSLMPDYVWRAALLALTVQLASSALLRSREHDADLRAAQARGGVARVTALVERTREADERPWRRLLAKHPSRTERLAVLERPALAARVTFVDGLTTGFLAGLSIPVIVSAVTTLLIGSGHTDDARLIAAYVAGPLLAGSVGLGLCRAALVGRLGGDAGSPARTALGVAAGLALGQAASLAQTGTGLSSLHPLAWLPLLALLGGAATMLAGSVAELLADAAPALRRAREAWLIGLLVTALLFSAAVWVGVMLETPLALGWDGVHAWLFYMPRSWPVLAALGAVAAAVLWSAWAARSARGAPAWALEGGDTARWPLPSGRLARGAVIAGLIAGATAVAALATYRAAAGTAATFALKEQRYFLFVWLGAAAALGAALPLAAARPPRGAAVAAAAATVACLTTVVGWLALNTALGGGLGWSFVTRAARQPLAVTFLVAVVMAPLMLVRPRRTLRAPAAWAATAAIVLACSGLLIVQRASLVPLGGAAGAESLAGGPAATGAAVDVQLYVTSFAPDVLRRDLLVQRILGAIAADGAADDRARADRLRREILPPLRALLASATAYRTHTAAVAAANATCIAALRASVRRFELLATAFANHDTTALANAQAAAAEEQRHWARWQQQLFALARGG